MHDWASKGKGKEYTTDAVVMIIVPFLDHRADKF